jgi:hypothetical protein
MVLCERELLLDAGSRSQSPHVCRELVRRDPVLADELAGWIVDNRGDNTYTPWGTPGDERTVAEHEARRRAFSERIIWEKEERERKAKQRGRRRAARRAARQRAHQRRAALMRPVREARIADLLARSEHECVVGVIEAEETADYWPRSIAERCRRGLAECTPAELEALLSRVRAARSDLWRAFRAPIRDEIHRRSETRSDTEPGLEE